MTDYELMDLRDFPRAVKEFVRSELRLDSVDKAPVVTVRHTTAVEKVGIPESKTKGSSWGITT